MTEILLYGDITSEKYLDEDTSAKFFVDKLNEADDEVTIRVNSAGGDVFAAFAIFNAIQNHTGTVTAVVDGLAASAASLIVCAADKIVMASNALMMIHLPSTFLNGFYSTEELNRAQNMLTSIENSLVDTYQRRLERTQNPLASSIDIRTMLKNETWFNARDALKWGFCDEISSPVEMTVDGNSLVVNTINFDIKKFDEVKLRRAIGDVNMVSKPQAVQDIAEIRAAEVNRIRALMRLRGINPVVDALVDVAIEKGQTVEEFQPYLDAVKNVPVENQSPVDKISNVIRDQMNSGAEGVKGGQLPVDKLSAQQNAIIKFANGGV